MSDIEDRLAKIEATLFGRRADGVLISLEDHQRKYLENYRERSSDKSRRNGIACPKCGAELYDSNPMVSYSSMPPSSPIHCEECKFTGSRYG